MLHDEDAFSALGSDTKSPNSANTPYFSAQPPALLAHQRRQAQNSMARKRKAAAEAAASDDDAPGPSSAAEDPLTSVVYIGHLPHGFYEDQLLGFFSQFGKLSRVRLSRSKKTAKPKHYAFLEFVHPDVAKIAAETMHGYFIFKQQLSCRVLKQSEVHPQLFKGANRKFKKVPWKKIDAERVNKERTPEEAARRIASLIAKDNARRRAIAAAGIDYEYEPLAAQLPSKPKKTKFAA